MLQRAAPFENFVLAMMIDCDLNLTCRGCKHRSSKIPPRWCDLGPAACRPVYFMKRWLISSRSSVRLATPDRPSLVRVDFLDVKLLASRSASRLACLEHPRVTQIACRPCRAGACSRCTQRWPSEGRSDTNDIPIAPECCQTLSSRRSARTRQPWRRPCAAKGVCVAYAGFNAGGCI